MCPVRQINGFRPHHMEGIILDRIIQFASKVGHLTLNGNGEPLVYPEFLNRIRVLDDMGVETSFSTNGTLLGVNSSAVRELSSLKHLSHLNISIDSPDPEIYYKIRGGKLENLIKGLRAFMNATPFPERVTVSAVVMKSNLQSLTELPELLKNLGVKRLILQKMDNHNNTLNEEEEIAPSELKAVLDNIRRSCANLAIALDENPCLEQTKSKEMPLSLFARICQIAPSLLYKKKTLSAPLSKQCMSPWISPFVNHDGQVFPCCTGNENPFDAMGNLKELDFEQIWAGKRFQDFRQALINGKLPDLCKNCAVAPVGPNPYYLYSAKILDLKRNENKIHLVAKNTGNESWRKGLIRIGTLNIIDNFSALYKTSWLYPNRICSFNETKVSPGGFATFDFEIASGNQEETFQLLVEKVCWLPDTQFKL